MTRLKKEFRKHGYKLQSDYPYFPYHEKPEAPALEDVWFGINKNNEIVCIKEYVVGTYYAKFDRNFNIIENDFI